MTSPQRFIANDRNVLRAAVLAASSVRSIDDSVAALKTARKGTAQVALTGTYTGAEEATYDVKIVDTTIATKVASSAVFSGKGSGTLDAIVATTVAPQDFVVELRDAGQPTTFAALNFEGVTLKAKASGAAGNLIHITIDQSGLSYADTSYSLLADLRAGSGDESSGFSGPGFDWDTKVAGADRIIPSDAHRIVFGDDTTNVYLNYKTFANGAWSYHTVPALQRDVPKGTRVRFVTGGRSVVVTDGSTTRTYSSIVTVYDLLNAIKTDASGLLTVDGIVANDRTPTGQAAHELLVRTDPHVEQSSGSGSAFATGVADAFADAGAATELITAKCFAVTSSDYPLAHLGNEYWQVAGSVSGDLGRAVTGVPFTTPDGKVGFTIPRKLPAGFGVQKGGFDVTDISYAPRNTGEHEPPICVVSLALGPSAVDQSITLRYVPRPSGDCLCNKMPKPDLRTPCLGITDNSEGDGMGYKSDTVAKLVSLYDWEADTVRSNSTIDGDTPVEYPFLFSPTGTGFTPETFGQLVADFESAIAQIDPLPTGALRTAGMAAWDTAFAEVESDVSDATSSAPTSPTPTTPPPAPLTGVATEALTAYDAVVRWFDGATWQMSKARTGLGSSSQYGFVDTGVAAAATATLKTSGTLTLSGLTPGHSYGPDDAAPGTWGDIATVVSVIPGIQGVAMSATSLAIAGVPATSGGSGTGATAGGPSTLAGLITDRYKTRLNWVLISAGISPLGKSDASTLESGDGCWRDWGDGSYWEVVGSAGGAYAPAFSNHPYYSSRKATGGAGLYFSTKEFAFQVNVKCPDQLKQGDQITLVIGNAAWGSTYQVGDELLLPIVGGEALYLAGGQDGSGTQTWYVTGSSGGAFPSFAYDPGSPTSYSSGGLAFTITPGGIPFESGDKFAFSIIGGHYEWRKNAGSWSSSLAIPTGATSFDSGLSITFTPGPAPSFVDDDVFSFRVRQPWAVSNVVLPDVERWEWSGDGQTLAVDLGSAKAMSAAALALHTLPAGCTITLQGGSTTGVGDWTELLTWQAGPIFAEFATTHTSRYVKFTFSSAPNCGIGWAWLGVPVTTELSADTPSMRSAYNVTRGSGGLFQGGRTLGKTVSCDVQWQDGAISEAERSDLLALVDWVKTNDDEPLLYVPQVTRPAEVLLARLNLDEVDFPDVWDYNPDSDHARRFSARIPLSGVWR